MSGMCIFEFSHFSFNTNGIFIAESKIKIVDMLLVITVILTIRETDSPKAGGINPKKNITPTVKYRMPLRFLNDRNFGKYPFSAAAFIGTAEEAMPEFIVVIMAVKGEQIKNTLYGTGVKICFATVNKLLYSPIFIKRQAAKPTVVYITPTAVLVKNIDKGMFFFGFSACRKKLKRDETPSQE